MSTPIGLQTAGAVNPIGHIDEANQLAAARDAVETGLPTRITRPDA